MLTLREQDRDERRRDLAQVYEAEKLLLQRIEEFHVELRETQLHARRLASEGTVSVELLLNSRRYQTLMKSQLASTQQQLAQVREEADREVKVLERLRERQQQQYNERESAREAKQLDEAALRGHLRHREVSL